MEFVPSTLLFSLFILGATAWGLGKALKRLTYAKFTILNDLDELGRPRPAGSKIKGTAVVCGGSIAGLIAARVCAAHFEDVVVIDPDADVLVERALAKDALLRPGGDQPANSSRPRLMQWPHFHSSPALYWTGLRRLFPALDDELRDANVSFGPADYNVLVGGINLPAPLKAYPPNLRSKPGLSRAANETLVRRLAVTSEVCSNVRYISGTVLGVDPSTTDRMTLRSVRYRPKSDSRASEGVEAALVVDASGVARMGLTWLQRAGYDLPTDALVESYNPHMHYNTCTFKIVPEAITKLYPATLCGESPLLANLTPPGLKVDRKYMTIKRIEGDRLLILAAGPGVREKVQSIEDLREFFLAMKTIKPYEPWLSELFDYLQTLPEENSTYVSHAVTALYRLKYHLHAKDVPRNFVAVGDSIMRVNPIYGGGLAKALVEATSLDRALRLENGPTLSAQLSANHFKRANDTTGFVWNTSKLGDYALEDCETAKGETHATGAGQRWYTSRVSKRGLRGDADIRRRSLMVRGWLAPPTELVAPSVLARVALDWALGR